MSHTVASFKILEDIHTAGEPPDLAPGRGKRVALYSPGGGGEVYAIEVMKLRLATAQFAYCITVGGAFDRDYRGDLLTYPLGEQGWRAARFAALEALEMLIRSDLGRWKAGVASS